MVTTNIFIAISGLQPSNLVFIIEGLVILIANEYDIFTI